jgi:hypothetical protein
VNYLFSYGLAEKTIEDFKNYWVQDFNNPDNPYAFPTEEDRGN